MTKKEWFLNGCRGSGRTLRLLCEIYENKIADLKTEIETKDILIKELQEQKLYWKNSSFDWRHKFFKLDKIKRLVKKDKQLTKAKEILAKLLEEEKNNMYWEMNGSDKSSYYEVRKQAEQFLSEVVKL